MHTEVKMLRVVVLLMCSTSITAIAGTPVVLWKPPPPAVGGMITSVDTDSIQIGDTERRATWRMDSWTSTPRTDGTGVWKSQDGRSISYVLIEVRINCANRTLREGAATAYFTDGASRNMPESAGSQFHSGVGASEVLVDYVCARQRE